MYPIACLINFDGSTSLTISSDHPFSMPRTYCTATWPWPTLTSMSVSEVWQDAVFFLLFWRPGGFLQARPLLFLEGLWTAMIKEPIQIPSNQATGNQPADQADELNKLSNIRIFEKSTMKERMKERTDQGKKERRKEGRKRMDGKERKGRKGREAKGREGRKGGGRNEHMDKWTNVIIHAIMDEQTKKEENQSIYKSINIPAESTKSQASFKRLSDLHISQPDNTSMIADPFALSFHQWIDRQVFAGPCGICTLEWGPDLGWFMGCFKLYRFYIIVPLLKG